MTLRTYEAADADVVELCTVGIDVGSSTSHLAFSRVRLERLASSLSSRYVVTRREQLWRSPVVLTPYEDDTLIDAAALGAFVEASERGASIALDDVDTGAVLLTGTALDRVNARAVAEAIAKGAGRFVCAAAGHHLEAELAAHGSGAVSLSAGTGVDVLAVDLGGGTAKFANCRAGAVTSTAVLAIGGRLIAWDGNRRIVRVERAARAVADDLGCTLELGAIFGAEQEQAFAARLAGILVGVLVGRGADALEDRLWLTEPPVRGAASIVSFSGGVAEYLDGREQHDFGDLGPRLAAEILAELAACPAAPKVVPAAQGIRATVIGASQFSTQVSGSTVLVPDDAALPVHGVPVVRPHLDRDAPLSAETVAAAVRRELLRRSETVAAARAVALSFALVGDPTYARLRGLADGIAAAVRELAVEALDLLVVVVDRDLGESIGRILREETGLVAPTVVALDGLDLGELDFLDLGMRREPSGVVPVVVKSLLFASPGCQENEVRGSGST